MLDRKEMQTQRVFDLFERIERRKLTPQQRREFLQIEAMFWVAKDANKPLSPAIEALNQLIDEVNQGEHV